MANKEKPVLNLGGVDRQFVNGTMFIALSNKLWNYVKNNGTSKRAAFGACMYFLFAVADYLYNNPDKYIHFGNAFQDAYAYKPDGITRFMTIEARRPLLFDNPHLRKFPKPEDFLKKYSIGKKKEDEIAEFKQMLTEFIDNLTFDSMENETQTTEMLKNIKELKDNKNTKGTERRK